MADQTVITGAVLVGRDERLGRATFVAYNPATGKPLTPSFQEAELRDVEDACRLAAAAFAPFSELAPAARATFLESAAAEIAALADTLIERAIAESGLPRARLEGERGRTLAQLQFHARCVREGGWLDVTIDHALPERQPVPRPDLRRCNVAIGPVAVFGAANFPLAFSVAGGDTSAAFAAGCPVVVKGHPAHAGTGELVARALRSAVGKCGLPAGVFSYLPGAGHELGRALVADPRIKAVGFTGSRAGGLALAAIAAARAEPIPVYAEMSSINPVFLFPAAARARGAELGRAYVASLTQGAGQFCTNPGLVIAVGAGQIDAFVQAAAEALAESPAQQMLGAGIHGGFDRAVGSLLHHQAVQTVARGRSGEGENLARAALFVTDAAAFVADRTLGNEVFGPSSLIVRTAGLDEAVRLLQGLEGQLTATVLFDAADEESVAALLPRLQQKVGRILANGWPTGVEVCHAMVHGGPFPATSDGRSTSVGALALQRFLRPVCYQNLPDRLLPAAVRELNPYAVPARIDGVLTPVS
jgi:alpha-ketoglutaric semialdehyde dehydrogenase